MNKPAAYRNIHNANVEIARLRQQRTDIVDQWEAHAATQDAEIKHLDAALAASQAREARLRGALKEAADWHRDLLLGEHGKMRESEWELDARWRAALEDAP